MLDSIEGELAKGEPTRIVIRVGAELGAVLYQARVPLGTAERLEKTGALVRLFVTTCVVEDLPRLFGFATEEERELFLLLRKVSGVGPKLALSLLFVDMSGHLLTAIHSEDVGFLKSIKGVGAKTAQRICLEIKDSAGKWLLSLGRPKAAPRTDPRLEDAVLALVSLGFAQSDAETRVRKANEAQQEAPTEELVKAALRG